MKISSVFLCGDKSPYGLAHLEAIAEHFDLKALIFADEARWSSFRSILSGGTKFEYQKPAVRLFHHFLNYAKSPLAYLRELRHKNKILKTGVPIYIFNDVNSVEALNTIKSINPEVIISAAYPQILKKPLLELSPLGAINFHPSLLPRCRGAHPHYWCLATGEEMGGVTAHYMTELIDVGDIIAQRSFSLVGLYYNELYLKIISETPLLVSAVAKFLNDKNAIPIPQDDKLSTYFRNDREVHHRLDFIRMSANQLHNRIRAGNAFCLFRGVRVNIVQATVVSSNRHVTNDIVIPPGIITDIDPSGIWIASIDGLFLVVNKLSNKRRVRHFTKWIESKKIQIGERFE